jgi:hypothetical protein
LDGIGDRVNDVLAERRYISRRESFGTSQYGLSGHP